VKVANGQNLLFTLFPVTIGQKYVKLGSNAYRKPPIYCEILEKFHYGPISQKTGPAVILKIPVLYPTFFPFKSFVRFLHHGLYHLLHITNTII
jgi:hypothetical protein